MVSLFAFKCGSITPESSQEDYEKYIKCNSTMVYSAINLLIILLIVYQIYFVNWLCYRVPIIQKCGDERQSTDHRQNVLLMALISCLYNVFHYLVIDYSNRAKYNSIVEILRTDVLILITFYYLRCASEEILRRRSYLIYK
jgi:hypothetical protein